MRIVTLSIIYAFFFSLISFFSSLFVSMTWLHRLQKLSPFFLMYSNIQEKNLNNLIEKTTFIVYFFFFFLSLTSSRFCFSSLHYVTVQSKIQYGENLCFEFTTSFDNWKVQSKISNKIYWLFLRRLFNYSKIGLSWISAWLVTRLLSVDRSVRRLTTDLPSSFSLSHFE